MLQRVRRFAPLLGLLLVLAACAAPTGSLQITITGLPTGQNASVNVAGPGNYGTNLTTTTTLAGLTPGTYTVTAGTVTTNAVTTEYDATITPGAFSVVAGETANVTVSYNPTGGTLAVSVSGLPPGIDADVNVTGPGSFDQDLTTSIVITDLAPGEYSATANPVSDGTNDYSATVSGSPAEVSSSTGAGIDVAYVLDPGSLDMTISGLPAGVDANVLVEGANGFSLTVDVSATLTDLLPGIYTLSAGQLLSDDPIVPEVYDLIGLTQSVAVESNSTSLGSVDFTLRPGSGHLWIPTASTDSVSAYANVRLGTSSSAPADITLASLPLSFPRAVAFDGAGNLWVTDSTDNTIIRIDEDQLAEAAPTPSLILSGASDPYGLAFDGEGTLWVTNLGGGTLEKFENPDLLGGTVTAIPDITLSGASVDGPIGMAFDLNGDLWVASLLNDTVLKYSAPHLLSGAVAPAPDVTLTGVSITSPQYLAFDAGGALWVSNPFEDTLVRFDDPQSLVGAASPEADATLSIDANGIAFDAGGAIWATNQAGTAWQIQDPGSLVGAVTPTPDVTITGIATNASNGIAFNPPPSDLPINVP
jgi:sugar lactone lactonase YvrE